MTKITIQIGDHSRTYGLYTTDAPIRYDYDCTLELASNEMEGKDLIRYVLIEQSLVEYQLGRNSSGLFYTTPSDDIPDMEINRMLWEKFMNAFPKDDV